MDPAELEAVAFVATLPTDTPHTNVDVVEDHVAECRRLLKPLATPPNSSKVTASRSGIIGLHPYPDLGQGHAYTMELLPQHGSLYACSERTYFATAFLPPTYPEEAPALRFHSILRHAGVMPSTFVPASTVQYWLQHLSERHSKPPHNAPAEPHPVQHHESTATSTTAGTDPDTTTSPTMASMTASTATETTAMACVDAIADLRAAAPNNSLVRVIALAYLMLHAPAPSPSHPLVNASAEQLIHVWANHDDECQCPLSACMPCMPSEFAHLVDTVNVDDDTEGGDDTGAHTSHSAADDASASDNTASPHQQLTHLLAVFRNNLQDLQLNMYEALGEMHQERERTATAWRQQTAQPNLFLPAKPLLRLPSHPCKRTTPTTSPAPHNDHDHKPQQPPVVPVNTPSHGDTTTAATSSSRGEGTSMTSGELQGSEAGQSALASRILEQWLHPDLLVALRADDPLTALRQLAQHETGPVYSLPFLRPEACDWLEAETQAFEQSPHPKMRPNSMNNYGLVLDDIGMEPLFDLLSSQAAQPIAQALLPATCHGNLPLDNHHAFVVQYRPTQDRSLDMHVDDSDATLNVNLVDGFEGSALQFCGALSSTEHRKHTFTYHHRKGRAVVHPGFQRHGADPILSGYRSNLILWCRASRYRVTEEWQRHRTRAHDAEERPDPVCLSRTHDADYHANRTHMAATA